MLPFFVGLQVLVIGMTFIAQGILLYGDGS